MRNEETAELARSADPAQLHGAAAQAGRSDRGTVDEHLPIDTRMPAMETLHDVGQGTFAPALRDVLLEVSEIVARGWRAVGRFWALQEQIATCAQKLEATTASASRATGRLNDRPPAGALHGRLVGALPVAIILLTMLVTITDTILIHTNMTKLGQSGQETWVIALGVSLLISGGCLLIARAAKIAWAKRQRAQMWIALAGLPALAGLVFTVAWIRVQAMSPAPLAEETADPVGDLAGTSLAASTPLAVTDSVLFAFFLLLMIGPFALAGVEFVATQPEEDWARKTHARAEELQGTSADLHEQEGDCVSEASAALTELKGAPQLIRARAESSAHSATAIGYEYLAELARSVPVAVAERVRDLPVREHEVPDWADQLTPIVDEAIAELHADVQRMRAVIIARIDTEHGADVRETP